MAGYVRDGGSWKQIQNLWVRDSGSWKSVQKAYVRDGGSWEQWYAKATAPAYSITAGGTLGSSTPVASSLSISNTGRLFVADATWSSVGGAYISDNSGSSWSQKYSSNAGVAGVMAADGNTMLVVTQGSNYAYSTSGGGSWSTYSGPYLYGAILRANAAGSLFAVADSTVGLYTATAVSGGWTQRRSDAMDTNQLNLGTSVIYAKTSGGQGVRSTNSGSSFSDLSFSNDVYGVSADGLYVIGSGFISSDSAATRTAVSGLSAGAVSSSGQYQLYAIGAAIYGSQDYGANFFLLYTAASSVNYLRISADGTRFVAVLSNSTLVTGGL